jgi:hypothetical protein
MEADTSHIETFLRGIPADRLDQPEDIKGRSVLQASGVADWITSQA